MNGLVVLPHPPGPPLVQMAAAADAERYPLLFDSGPVPGPFARWNMLVLDPVEVVCARAGEPAWPRLAEALARAGAAATSAGSPTEADGELASGHAWAHGTFEDTRESPGLPPFRGGAAGLLGYDLGRELERLLEKSRPDGDLPDLLMGIYPCVLAEECVTGRRVVVGHPPDGESGARRFAAALEDLSARARPTEPPTPVEAEPTSTFERSEYLAAVERVREHILDGDVYQVNLSQRFEVRWPGHASDLQAALRERFAAPFAALLRTPEWALVSSSPELFLRKRGGRLLSRPIKGTRPRGDDPSRDAALRAELEASAKEGAELAMIVDLVRNDLGRSACIGSVEVELPFETEAWSTVFHRVGCVHARVPEGTSPLSIVAAAFPPASVTGTPKIRALEVIESLEPVRRHAYTGALGWIGLNGDMDLSVLIRIATQLGDRLLVPVGGGITLDSDPAAEYEETLHKARAIFDVLGLRLPDSLPV